MPYCKAIVRQSLIRSMLNDTSADCKRPCWPPNAAICATVEQIAEQDQRVLRPRLNLVEQRVKRPVAPVNIADDDRSHAIFISSASTAFRFTSSGV